MWLIVARIDILSEQFRQYQNSDLFPTSHGDYIDRAVKSLAKQLGVPVGVDLQNAQAVQVRLLVENLFRRK